MRKWLPLAAICLGAFMLLVDVSIVNVALPGMAADLHSSFSDLQWVVDAYVLTLAALLMALGSLGDRLGHRRLYLGGLAVFAFASVACALADDAGTLISARAVQGVGAAGMMTATTALLTAAYQGRDRGVAFGVWGAVSGAAAAVGPVLGGLLTDGFGWPAIFLVNVPVALVAVLLTAGSIPIGSTATGTSGTGGAGRGRPDVAGAVTFTVFAGALTYGLIESGDHGWGRAAVLGPLGVAAGGLLLFVLVELRAERPLLDLSLLRNRAFVGLSAAGMLLNAAAFADLTYTSLWLQRVLDLGPLAAGLALCPLALAAFAVALVGGRLLGGVNPWVPIAAGLGLIGGGALLLALVDAGSGWTVLLPGLVVCGIGVGLATPTLMSTALATVERERAGMASGAVNTARQLGYALGIAVLGSVFQTGARGNADLRAAYAAGLDRVYLVAGGTGLAAALVVLILVRRHRATVPHPAAEPKPRVAAR